MIFLLRHRVWGSAWAALIVLGLTTGPGLSADAPAPQSREAIEKIVHDYLLAHPEILREMSAALTAKDEATEQKLREQALAKAGRQVLVDPKIAYLVGPPDAKVTVVEFFDYRCPHCKNSLPDVKRLVETDHAVRFSFIEYPILTQDSVEAAKAAVAARRQGDKYLAFHFALMATTGSLPKERILSIAKDVGLDVPKLEKDMNDPAVEDVIKQSIALADKLHFNGTPTFVINNTIIVGELTHGELADLVKKNS